MKTRLLEPLYGQDILLHYISHLTHKITCFVVNSTLSIRPPFVCPPHVNTIADDTIFPRNTLVKLCWCIFMACSFLLFFARLCKIQTLGNDFDLLSGPADSAWCLATKTYMYLVFCYLCLWVFLFCFVFACWCLCLFYHDLKVSESSSISMFASAFSLSSEEKH